MPALKKLFIANILIVLRNSQGLFWTIIMPAGLYVGLSILPIPELVPGLKYSSYLLPGVIAYTIMQSGIYSLAYWMVDLKGRGIIKRFLVTPIKTRHLILSLVYSRLIITLAQVIILSLLGVIIFHAGFVGNFLTVAIYTFLGGAIFLLLGLLISNYASSYETAAPLTAAVGMPLAFLGDIFFPLSSLPKGLQTVGRFLPMSHLASGMRNAFLNPHPVRENLTQFLILGAWLLILLVITIKVFRLKED